jgi:hypothetical protein
MQDHSKEGECAMAKNKAPMTPDEVAKLAASDPSFHPVLTAEGKLAGWTHETYEGYVFGYYADGTGVAHCLRAFSSSFESMRETLRAGKPECRHSWVAGMMNVHDEDLDTVAKVRKVECEKCEAVYHA